MFRVFMITCLLVTLSAQDFDAWKKQIEQVSQSLSKGENSKENARLLYKYFFQVENQSLCEEILSIFVRLIEKSNKETGSCAANMLVKIAQKDLPEVVLHFLSSLDKHEDEKIKMLVNNVKSKIALYEENSINNVDGNINVYFSGYHRYNYNYRLMVIENPNEYPIDDVKVVLHIPFSMKYETSLLGEWDESERTSTWYFTQIKAKEKLEIPLCYPRRVFRYFNTNKTFRVEVFSQEKMITVRHVQMYLMCLQCSGLPIPRHRIKSDLATQEEAESSVLILGDYSGTKNLRVTYILPKEFIFLSAEPNHYTYKNNKIAFAATEIAFKEKKEYKIRYKTAPGYFTTIAKVQTDKSDEYYSAVEDVKHLRLPKLQSRRDHSSKFRVRKILPKVVSDCFADIENTDEETIKQSLYFMLIYYKDYSKLVAILPKLIDKNLSPENLDTLIAIFERAESKEVVPALLQMFLTAQESLQRRILQTLNGIGVENDMVLRVLEIALQKNSNMKKEALELAENTKGSYPSLQGLLVDILIYEKSDMHDNVVRVLSKMNLLNAEVIQILVQKLQQVFSEGNDRWDSWGYSQIKTEIYRALIDKKDASVVPTLLKLKPSSLYDQRELVTTLWKITGNDYSKDIISAEDLKNLDLKLEEDEETDW
ncbi:hypothetical protein [Candidatus Uabimicrobium sp. HlEnr_7]|uniref:hypothetical protein n=1 Tax=Candidatus Uabimicrobium helgolandensis TaxID=3095367 RepID=UPI003558CFC3